MVCRWGVTVKSLEGSIAKAKALGQEVNYARYHAMPFMKSI